MNDFKRFKKNPNTWSFNQVFESVKILEQEMRGGPLNFTREPKSGARGELWFRDRLSWLRTIPLSVNECFLVLHKEAGVYGKDKRKCSADLIGLHRKSNTTLFTIAELKYGKKGDPLPYACAEGLRNLYLHLQGFERLGSGWRKAPPKPKSIWGNGNPFAELAKTRASLLIIGDHDWATAQKRIMRRRFLPKHPVKLGDWIIEIAVYSSPRGARDNSKPYRLLPMKKVIL